MYRQLFLMTAFLAAAVIATGCQNPDSNADVPHASIEITSENFEALVLNSETPVLLDFWAIWCRPCIELGPTIEKLATEYDGRVTVGKVNVDEQQAIAQKYKINGIPALLYFKNGELVNQQAGALPMQSMQSISNVLDSMLD